MRALPRPLRGGAITLLKDFVNVTGEDDFLLLVAWLVAALRPTGPFPILALVSEQGSGKSTTSRNIRRLIDPNASLLRTMPRDERELAVNANSSCILAFDNVSGIPNRMSDALCRTSTGGGYSCRSLYTDAEEALFEAQRPILVNGIDDVGTRPDLAERCIVLSLAAIDESARRDERSLSDAFALAAPQILGALLDLSAAVLSLEPQMSFARLPRMADFARLGCAVGCAMGGTAEEFLDAYERNALKLVGAAVDSDPVAAAVQALLDSIAAGQAWIGTPTDLLERLKSCVSEDVRRSDAWPRAANVLGNRLRRLKPTLRRFGISMEERRARKRVWELRKVVEGPTSASSPGDDVVDAHDDDVDDGHERPTSSVPTAVVVHQDNDDDDGHLHRNGLANGTAMGPHGYPADWDV
jgi:hypothetical protein